MSDRLWYFAYGSNLARSIFQERRAIEPAEIRVGRLSGFRLCFDLPIGRGERGVANVVDDPGSHVWGALYLLTHDQFEHLDRTEGVPNGIYVRREVTVHVPSSDEIVAYTYHSSRGRAGRKPSPRYMGLILDGAAEHALPEDYVDYLRSFELAHDERGDVG